MILKSFSVRNYRSCNNTKSDLHPNLTCLVGRNGAGKTSFLFAMQLLRQVFNARLGRYPGNYEQTEKQWSCELDAVAEFNEAVIVIRAKVRFVEDRSTEDIEAVAVKMTIRTRDGKRENVKAPLDFLRMIARDARQGMLRSGFTGRIPVRTRKGYRTRKIIVTDLQAKLMPELFGFLDGIRYYGASKFTNPSIAPNYFEIDPSRPPAGQLDGTSHSRVIHDIYQASAREDSEYSEFKRIVCEDLFLIKDIAFETFRLPSNQLKVLQGGKVKTIASERQVIIPRVTLINGKIISPSQLSEGTFKTVALLFYLVTDSSRLLLIEEPEVCVHHGLLDRVVDIIKSFSHKKQIIISTHSEFVLDVLGEENVLIVRNSATLGTRVRALSKALSKRQFAALRRYLQQEGNLGEYLSHRSQDIYE